MNYKAVIFAAKVNSGSIGLQNNIVSYVGGVRIHKGGYDEIWKDYIQIK